MVLYQKVKDGRCIENFVDRDRIQIVAFYHKLVGHFWSAEIELI